VRLLAPSGAYRLAAWLLLTLALSAGFARLAAHNLANFRPVSNDEVELMAVGYKLATQGVFGSDMYAGFFGGDQHHFETLPLQHVLDALSFRLFGPGVLQARVVSLLAGISIIWTSGWLAYRWYGPGTAVVCELLAVGWASNLTAASNGLPLLGVARTARYDVLAVAVVGLTIVLLDAMLRQRRVWRGLAVGVGCGLAALSQFFGSFALLFVLAVWRWSRPPLRVVAGWLAGVALVVTPYALFVARYRDDAIGQLAVFGNRGDFLRPTFYIENVLSEWTRYAHLAPPTSLSSGVLLFGLVPALGYLAWRRSTGDRLLLFSLVTFAAALTLLDQTKVPLYSILLLPSICLTLAAAFSAVLGWAWRGRTCARLRIVLGAFALAALVGIGLEGAAAYRSDWDEANQATPYLALGQQIEAAIPPGAAVLGPERWWWALHDHRYLSLRSLWFQWSASARRAGNPKFVDWVTRAQPDSVIVSVNVRADVQAFPEALQAQFWSFVDDCTTLVADLDDATYFDIQVYAVRRPPPETCG
jgi:4-amino-4-deoxy-L-arabinose transferase-like glycosyltransferase